MNLKHLGIIADGNRRWAKENNLPKIEGHKRGLKTIETLVEAAARAGIPYVTFYVFSTENWGREKSEVDYIMKLAETKILKMAEKMAANNVKLLILGSRGKVNPTLTSLAEKAEKITEDCTGTTACFCFNYGGEQEIADAANIAIEAEGEITPATIRKHLYHPEVPDLDMVVRTSGEERISGFMLWRAAYAEFMFLEKYFPEMEAADIQMILEEYESRNRRFGK
ncbi:di-trans,poly-cis-decaprenylcistransferase [Candidatus Saccharibacteria bacterium]|uniref:Isoprenyl transferase n=1 Tax=Candidatus Nanosyncoccus alces TaxID=2171997 RepID=A0ABY0FLB7_9BACT|nr:polyprenyl diphosphate synthase [Candidatus Nanosyncoccus alces]MBQ2643594.1 di-trans,poly-cis-decaprenylcistransferase [Candidatus Saccharibacteria bacterium]RYC74526.1 Trans,polycis-polyprenyl diphosphate synthase ((2Z,6E)-farnesyl diphosphate specific) [Candidatus Nanosyncoccus alces]